MTNSLARTNGRLAQGEGRAAPWTPYRDLFGFDPFQALRSNWAFDYDVSRTETGYEVEVPVPGYKPEQIDVTFKDGATSDAMMRPNVRRPIVITDGTALIDTWAKLYRFEGPALN